MSLGIVTPNIFCVIISTKPLTLHVDLQSITREQHEEDIRSIIREEMRACFAEANFAPQPVNPALSTEQQEEAEQEILDDLKLFD